MSRDYSNFDMSQWRPRDKHSNRQQALQWSRLDTQQARTEHERQYGTRMTMLHELKYFDPIRCTIIDPMHNLFSGTASRMMHHWIKERFITKQELEKMEKQLESFSIPPGYTVAKGHIKSGFAGMTSDEWRSWTMVYSVPLLIGKLHTDDLTNWVHFVRAVRLLCQPSISPQDIDEAHGFLLKFCTGCVDLYGASFITPNMHLHCHLGEVVRDFGPVYGFWLFSFERYNGILKNIDTNSKDRFELTFMKQFLRDSMGTCLTDEMFQGGDGTFAYKIARLLVSPSPRPDNNGHHFDVIRYERYASLENRPAGDLHIAFGNEPLPPSSFPLATGDLVFMDRGHYEFLYQYYCNTYRNWFRPVRVGSGGPRTMYRVNDRIKKITKIDILGQTFLSLASRQTRLGCAITITITPPNGERILAPARALYYFVHHFNGEDYYFALVEWYEQSRHLFLTYQIYDCSACRASFPPLSSHSIVPIQRIHGVVSLAPAVDDHLLARYLPRKIKNAY